MSRQHRVRACLLLTACDEAVLATLAQHAIRGVIVGGRAMYYHGAPREPGDLDLLVSTAGRPANLASALRVLGCDLSRIDVERLSHPKMQIPIKHGEFDVDLLTSLHGIEFDQAYENACIETLSSFTVRVLAIPDLKRCKRMSGRPEDLEDVRALEEV